jgi:hypothetical protein
MDGVMSAGMAKPYEQHMREVQLNVGNGPKRVIRDLYTDSLEFSKEQGVSSQKRAHKGSLSEFMQALHDFLLRSVAQDTRLKLYAAYQADAVSPMKAKLLCENDFAPDADYTEADASIQFGDILRMWVLINGEVG